MPRGPPRERIGYDMTAGGLSSTGDTKNKCWRDLGHLLACVLGAQVSGATLGS
jgi:hypothetical protein